MAVKTSEDERGHREGEGRIGRWPEGGGEKALDKCLFQTPAFF
jgi:hypothetical protein